MFRSLQNFKKWHTLGEKISNKTNGRNTHHYKDKILSCPCSRCNKNQIPENERQPKNRSSLTHLYGREDTPLALDHSSSLKSRLPRGSKSSGIHRAASIKNLPFRPCPYHPCHPYLPFRPCLPYPFLELDF